VKQPEQEPLGSPLGDFAGGCLTELFTGCLFDGCLAVAFPCLAVAAVLYWLV
jgi:hypothetical protein